MTHPELILRAALAQHRSGALAAACDLYRQVLELRPANHDALHLLGVARAALGETAEGIALVQQAIAVNPNAAPPHFNLGRLLLAQRQPEAALRSFLACIALSPNHARALTEAGRTLHALHRPAEALSHYARALALGSADPALWNDLGTALSAAGRPDEALRAHDEALRIGPRNADAHCNRGRVLLLRHDYAAAEAALQAALAIEPDHLAALLNLAYTLGARGRIAEALAATQRLLALEPDNLAARTQRGLYLNASGRHADAVEDLTAVLHAAPDHPQALAARGGAFWTLRDWDRAEADLDRALALDPDNVGVLIDRGNVFHDRQQYDAALACYDKALALQPDNIGALMNRGGSLQSLQRHAEALAAYRQVLALRPEHADAELNTGLCQLRAGNWREGWQAYEARWRQPRQALLLQDLSGPRWDGQSDLSGKRVLLVSEQGLGDTIQFARFAQVVADRGATAILGVQQPLHRLMFGIAGVSEVAVQGAADPAYDVYLPLMSLIAALGLGIDAVATPGPYLRADPAAASVWRERLAGLPGLKVGLAWAGDPRAYDRTGSLMDARRSIPLARLAPLLAVEGVTFVSLQKGEDQATGVGLLDRTAELNDFADTAALIEALDLVIAVDTAVAHLAGALGRPVWTLNRFDRCWRWMWDRTDTPWYPTMRLFTQPAPGEWDAVVAEVAEALQRELHSASGTVQAS